MKLYKVLLKILATLVIVGVVGILVCLALIWTLERAALVDWNTWVNTVHIAGQEGSTEAFARESLGQPQRVWVSDEPERVALPPLPVVTGTKKVLIYNKVFFLHKFWSAYIFIGNDGKVQRVHIIKPL
jgi:hypothetical protein